MRKHIFNIIDDYRRIIDQLDELEGELTPELEELLKINEEEIEQKCEAYISIINEEKGDINTIDDEIARLTNLKNSKLNKIENLKKYLQLALITYGEDGKTGNKKMTIGTHKIWNVYTKPLLISDESKVPDDYKKWIVTAKFSKERYEAFCDFIAGEEDFNFEEHIEKTKLKDAINAKQLIEGVTLDTTSNYIRIL
jgi:hypothetical protein